MVLHATTYFGLQNIYHICIMYHVSLYLFFTGSKNTRCICTAFTYCYVSVQVSEWQRMLLFCSSSIYRMSQLFCIPWSCCDLQHCESVSRRQVRHDHIHGGRQVSTTWQIMYFSNLLFFLRIKWRSGCVLPIFAARQDQNHEILL